MGDFEYLNNELWQLKEQSLYRTLRQIESSQGPRVRIQDKEYVLFCSNNYLNLAQHPRVRQAAANAILEYGLGSGASRLVSGTMPPHAEIEEKMARFLQKQAGLFFPSGWTANEALLKTLPKPGDLVLLDKLDHASIIDAVRAGGCDFRTFRRGQLERLKRLLADSTAKRKFIVTESVFSMDGDTADLKTLVELKNRFGAFLILDEAHGIGCLGPGGRGLTEDENLLDEIDIILAPLGKALGASGAVIVGPQTVIDYLINCARAFIYTTAPVPAVAAGACAALDILQNEPFRRLALQSNAAYLRNRLTAKGLNIAGSTTQIIPVILGDSEQALAVSASLMQKGCFISAIRPPTVPEGTARLRISVQSEHTRPQMDELCNAIENIMTESRKSGKS